MAFLRQTNFLGGELSPLLHGRTDHPSFSSGVAGLKNFFITKQGSAVSRPGLLHLGFANTTGVNVRLIPFVVSDSEAFVVELTGNRMRFWFEDQLVQGVSSPIQLTTPWNSDQLRDIRFAQIGNTMTLVHPEERPQELTRLPVAPFTWSLTPVTFTLKPTPNEEITNSGVRVARTPWKLEDNPIGYISGAGAPTLVPLKEWRYMYTAVVRVHATGRTYETKAETVDLVWRGGANAAYPADGLIAISPSWTQKLVRQTAGTPSILNPDEEILGYNFYRGRGTLFGFVGTTKGDVFVDAGAEPDYSIQPPTGRDPFTSSYQRFQLPSFSYPATVAYFEERRVFGGMPNRANTIIGSATGDYDDFSELGIIPTATSPIEYELAFRRRERIRDFAQLRRLLVFTDSSVWAVGPGLSADDIPPVIQQDEVGAGGPSPLVFDGVAMFARTKGKGCRAFYADNTQGFAVIDIADHAEHLFYGESQQFDGTLQPQIGQRYIVDWCYAEDPHGLVWAVRDDGALLSMTATKQALPAWSRHDSFGIRNFSLPSQVPRNERAEFLSICSIPQGDEDVVYVAVKRRIGALPFTLSVAIERFESRRLTSKVDDEACLDSAVKLTLPFAGLVGSNQTLAPHLGGRRVWVTGRGFEPFTVQLDLSGAGDIPSFAPPGFNPVNVECRVGLKFDCEMKLLPVVTTDTRARQKTTTRVLIEVAGAGLGGAGGEPGLLVGETEDNLVAPKVQTVVDGYNPPPLANAIVEVPVRGTWTKYGGGFLRMTTPRPLMVLGVVREVEVGG